MTTRGNAAQILVGSWGKIYVKGLEKTAQMIKAAFEVAA
jgi:hypothetical protein